MGSPLTESDDRWEVDLHGYTVEMLTIDHRVTLHLFGATGYDASLVLEAPFSVVDAATETATVDPEDKASLKPVLGCFGKTVAAASVSRVTGTLTLRFADGTVIEATSRPQYEAWDLTAAGVKIVSLPGGGEPALWVT